jgi:hypothetical protein
MTVMDLIIHASFLGKRWITVGPADQLGTSTSGLPVRL